MRVEQASTALAPSVSRRARLTATTVTGRKSMNNTTRAAIVLTLLLQGLAAAACGDRGSVTGPTATVSVGVTAKISISGVVYDTAHRLISGARVEVIEGTVGDWCHYGVQPAPVCIVDDCHRWIRTVFVRSADRGCDVRECDPITGEYGGLPIRDVDRRFHHVDERRSNFVSSRASLPEVRRPCIYFFGRSIRTTSEFCCVRSNTMCFPSGVMSKPRRFPCWSAW